MRIPALKLPIKRGALLAAANWPVVVLQFIAEATFKGLARSLRAAVAIDPRRSGIASTKGSLA